MKLSKYEPSKRKPIREVEADMDYSGEQSPYWNFMSAHQDLRSAEQKIQEDPLANPDMFSEEKSLYNRPLSPDGEIKLQAVHEVEAELSPQQKKVLYLCGYLGRTMEEAAGTMGITLATVQTLLNRARQKIQRQYEKLVTTGE